MSNHAHFAIYTEEIEKLGKMMHEINSKYARMYNKEKNRCGKVLNRCFWKVSPLASPLAYEICEKREEREFESLVRFF